jgi:hypothetical protein
MLDVCSNSWRAGGCPASFWYLWGMMDWFGHAAITLLAIMLVNAAVIFGDRLCRYSAARRQSHVFVRDAAAALRDGRWSELMAVAARSTRGHVASVVAAGLTMFASAPPRFTDLEAIEAADRAFQRSRRMLTADLRHGLCTLSTIAGSALYRTSRYGLRHYERIRRHRNGEIHGFANGGRLHRRGSRDDRYGTHRGNSCRMVPQLPPQPHGGI